MTEPQAPACAPGHTDVTELAMNMLQKSDGTAQFTCNICGVAVVKLMATELDFVKKYKRHHQLCVDHVRDREYLPTSKDDDGDLSCNWCGEKIREIPTPTVKSDKREVTADDPAIISALAYMARNITTMSQASVNLMDNVDINQMLTKFFTHHITEDFTDPAVDYLQLGKSFTGLGLVMTYLGSMFLTVDRERTEAKVKTETASSSAETASSSAPPAPVPTATSPVATPSTITVSAPTALHPFERWIELPKTVNGKDYHWDSELAHKFAQQLSSSLVYRDAEHAPYYFRFTCVSNVHPVIVLRFRNADAVHHCGTILYKPFKFDNQEMTFTMHEAKIVSSFEITEHVPVVQAESHQKQGPIDDAVVKADIADVKPSVKASSSGTLGGFFSGWT